LGQGALGALAQGRRVDGGGGRGLGHERLSGPYAASCAFGRECRRCRDRHPRAAHACPQTPSMRGNVAKRPGVDKLGSTAKARNYLRDAREFAYLRILRACLRVDPGALREIPRGCEILRGLARRDSLRDCALARCCCCRRRDLGVRE
jgi:hypothetical protein